MFFITIAKKSQTIEAQTFQNVSMKTTKLAACEQGVAKVKYGERREFLLGSP